MWVSDSVPHTENETHTPSYTRRAILATKIRLKRMGKKFYAFYRVSDHKVRVDIMDVRR